MNRFVKDKEHLVRMAALFAAGVVVFLILQAVLVPKGFGVYGHYRAGALADNRVRVPRFAGRTACIECHTDERDAWKGGKHAGVACEACHGALAKHAEDPSSSKVVKPDPKTICFTCHLTNVAKPKKFPQMDPKNHFDGGACNSCHAPHAPDKEPKK
jgi:Cytochrome c554 and c-prime